MAVGIDSVGTERYFHRVFQGAGLDVPNQVQKFLDTTDRRSEQKSTRQKKPAVKWVRAKSKRLKMKADLLANEKARREGVDYGAGIAVSQEEDDEEDDGNKKPAAKRTTEATTGTGRNVRQRVGCKRCGSTNHQRSTKYQCHKHPEYKGPPPKPPPPPPFNPAELTCTPIRQSNPSDEPAHLLGVVAGGAVATPSLPLPTQMDNNDDDRNEQQQNDDQGEKVAKVDESIPGEQMTL